MKKICFYIGIASLAFTGCAKDDVANDIVKGTTITATFENGASTRLNIADDNALTWSAGDSFALFGEGSSAKFTLQSGAGSATAVFTGTAPSTILGAAFPYTDEYNPALSSGTLSMTLPAELDQSVNGVCNLPMWAATTSATNVAFKHLAGVLRINFTDMPKGYNALIVTASNPISGAFTATTTDDEPVLASTLEDVANKKVTVEFTAATEDENDNVFYIPLPVGEYESIEISVSNGEDTKNLITYNDKEVERARVYTASLTYSGVTGTLVTEVDNADALQAAITAGQSVVLTDNITLTQPLTIGATPMVRSSESNVKVTLDLNGKTLTTAEDNGDNWSAALIVYSGDVVIKNGTIATGGEANHNLVGAVWVRGTETANVTIENGVFKGNSWKTTPATPLTDDLMATIYVSNANGKVTINGGEFYAVQQEQVAGQNQILNYTNSFADGTIEVKGGKFYGMNPAIGNGVEVSYLADGYSSVETETGVFEVKSGIHTEEALKAAVAAGKTEVTLGANIDLTSSVVVSRDLVVNLNGKSIKCALSDVFVVNDGTLTINGEGLVYGSENNEGNSCAVWVNGANAKAIINNGTYKVGGDIHGESDQRNDCIYVGKAGGTIEIYGGVFEYTGAVKDGSLNDGSRFLVNQNDGNATQLITVYGGTFHNFDPANANTNEPWMTDGVGSFVAAGYSSVAGENNTYVVKKDN